MLFRSSSINPLALNLSSNTTVTARFMSANDIIVTLVDAALLPDRELSFAAEGPASGTLVIEAANAPESGAAWVPVRTNAPFNGRFQFIAPIAPSSSPRFYRARWEP